jgi:predicted TIM-barrel fold metal-dependent hydrolase
MKLDLASARREFLANGNGGDDALLPIVDAHHHFWSLRNPHPWLTEMPRIAFRYGDYEAICRDYLPADHAAATQGHRVVRSVVMEGEWDPRDPVNEALWLHELAVLEGTPHAVAAQIRLGREDCAAVLSAYGLLPIVRSVRHKPKAAPRAAYREDWAPPGSMRCSRWRAGYAQLEAAGLMFELQVPWWHMGEAVELSRDFPRTTIVVNHAGLPSDRDDESLGAWRRAMGRLADCENVQVKISGIGVPGVAWTPELQQPIVDSLIAAFGAQRCLFASNHPVDGLVASFDTIFSSFKQLTRELAPTDRLALFCDNAVRLYRLE